MEETKKKRCVLIDIDGTVCNKFPDRNIYDETKCHLDLPVLPVIEAARAFQQAGYSIIFLSGRHEKAREGTKKFFATHNVPYDDLFMRADKDNRKDTIIKTELYREHIEPYYDVLAVIDDRLVVVAMWVSLGLFVFNVNQHLLEY